MTVESIQSALDSNGLRKCKCGCGKKIKVKEHHSRRGVTEYRHGHHAKEELPETAFEKGQTPWNKGVSNWLSEEHREKINEAVRNVEHNDGWFVENDERITGKNNPFWNGGSTKTITRIRNCLKYKEWRNNIFERDDYTCRKCGQRGGELHVDHIKPLSKILDEYFEDKEKSFEEAKTIDEIWDTENGRVLCKECHKKTETYGNYKGV